MAKKLSDRLPPHSTEAERGVIGCILQSPKESIGLCVESLPNPDGVFYDQRHQLIYDMAIKMSGDLIPVDLISLQDKMKVAGTLEQIGGLTVLMELQDEVPSAHNLPYYLDILREKFTLRKLLATCTEISSRVYQCNDTVDVFMDGVEKDILAIRPNKSKATGIKSLVQEAITLMEYRCQHQDEISGFTTGLIDLDKLSDGVHKGEVVVVAGQTSTGKTALSVNIATTNALKGIPAAIFSAEMLPVKIAVRMICSEARANFKRLNESNVAPLTDAAGKVSKAPIYIESASGMTIGQVQAVARRLKQKHDIQIFVIDYLQLLSGAGDNREQQISSISKGVRAIALELNCAVIALSQLTDDGRLRESRSIGHDADSVWKLENDGEWQPKIQPIKLNIEKCRDGETGKVDLTFHKEITRFKNVSLLPE